MAAKDIKDLDIKELERELASFKQPRFHAQQIFSWIYKKGETDFTKMSDLPENLRGILRKNFAAKTISLLKNIKSIDGTEKLFFELHDGNHIEAVIIPSEDRITGCVSTQVGCKFNCKFCASGALGFKRNLTCGEIIEEVLFLRDNCRDKKLTHLVFMGTGEPLDNYDNLLKAIKIINCRDGLNIGARRITISTCGVIPGIERLSCEGLQIELSVSLHAPDDMTRSLIMPINKVYPFKALLDCCRRYIEKTNRQVTFEYVLIKAINSDLQKAESLGKILKGLNCKVNLIPCNPISELKVEPPNKLEILMFKGRLLKSGINVTLRKPRGEDIEAACGQLRLRYEKK